MQDVHFHRHPADLRLNALSGIGGVRTHDLPCHVVGRQVIGLNALSGIGGVRTEVQ